MSSSNGCGMPGDIGGAMDSNAEYRWNVPVLTYGFDQSFIDYFGSNGVAAVEGVFQTLNDLPAAADVTLTNFPLDSQHYNFAAQGQSLVDLKSVTLALMLQRLGLASPTRHIFDLRRFDPTFLTNSDEASWPPGTIPNLILERNFDPETVAPSHAVNAVTNTGYVTYATLMPQTGTYWEAIEFRKDPSEQAVTAVADQLRNQLVFPSSFDTLSSDTLGEWVPGLTQDDVGGLRYLLSTNNVNLETLLPDVRGRGTNANSFVNLALRPGLEKITFVRQPYDASLRQFLPLTNQYTDTYITNGSTMHQDLERVTVQPDFLFSLADLQTIVPGQRGWTQNGTSNWWDSATVSGSTNTGPGVIRPPAHITFDTRGDYVSTQNGRLISNYRYRWASFDGSTNAPVIYPQPGWPTTTQSFTVHLLLENNAGLSARCDLHANVPLGGQAILQTSTDLLNWTSVNDLDPLQNNGEAVTWDNWCSASRQYFRLLPQ